MGCECRVANVLYHIDELQQEGKKITRMQRTVKKKMTRMTMRMKMKMMRMRRAKVHGTMVI